jgi:hypothetical protein
MCMLYFYLNLYFVNSKTNCSQFIHDSRGFFSFKKEARNFYWLLINRLKKFNLEVEKSKTSKKKFITKVKEFNQWIKAERNRTHIEEIFKKTKQKLVGHYQYYGITDNSYMLGQFCLEVKKALFK